VGRMLEQPVTKTRLATRAARRERRFMKRQQEREE